MPMINKVFEFICGRPAFDYGKRWVLTIVSVDEERGHFGIVLYSIVLPITVHYPPTVDG